MQRYPLLLTLGVAALATVSGARLHAAEDTAIVQASAMLPGKHCPHCQEEVVYHEVITHRCVLVPDVKQIKKTVYECKEVPFCLPKLPPLFSHLRHDCCDSGPCPECECPRYKKVLLKKEIVCKEICGTKCVIEEVVERVPCRVCKPCPHCSAGAAGCVQPAGPPAPVLISDQPPQFSTAPLVRLPPVPMAE